METLETNKIWYIAYEKPSTGWLCAVDNAGRSLGDASFYTSVERARYKLAEFQKAFPDRPGLRVVEGLLVVSRASTGS